MSLLAWIASACVALVNMRGWYTALVPPVFVPGAAMLVSSWSVLAACYLAAGLAAWLVWRRPLAASRERAAMNVWGWQLALGAAWPAVFFGLHLLLPAALLAVGLVAIAAITLWRFARLDRMAGFLLVPYFGFTLATLYVNAGFWWLNH